MQSDMKNIQQILAVLQQYGISYEYSGNQDYTFEGFCPLNLLKDNCIIWARDSNSLDIEEINTYHNMLIFLEKGTSVPELQCEKLYVDEVHRTYFRVLAVLFDEINPANREAGISATAVVETKNVGKNLYVGHQSYIGPDVIIGDDVTIMHHVTIQNHVVIGNGTVIESGSVIGACGFGHYHDEKGHPVCVPHFGGVRIGNNVTIGANNAISRGCLADTIIEDDVKTDNLCHIAHNDHIKRGAMLTANTVISGSTTVGENAWLAPGTLLNNSITVGDDAYTGIGAVATKSIPEGKVVVGMPAKVLRDRY